MAIQVRIIAQQVDSETNKLIAEQEVYTKLAVAPIKIDDLGFSHKEQIEILQGSQEMILQAQAEEINHQSQTCPQ